MGVLYPHCAGLDVRKDTVVACVRLAVEGTVQAEVRTFDTTVPGLLALADWLNECGCTHVGMEATGANWKPVWHILSDVTGCEFQARQKCLRIGKRINSGRHSRSRSVFFGTAAAD